MYAIIASPKAKRPPPAVSRHELPAERLLFFLLVVLPMVSGQCAQTGSESGWGSNGVHFGERACARAYAISLCTDALNFCAHQVTLYVMKCAHHTQTRSHYPPAVGHQAINTCLPVSVVGTFQRRDGRHGERLQWLVGSGNNRDSYGQRQPGSVCYHHGRHADVLLRDSLLMQGRHRHRLCWRL